MPAPIQSGKSRISGKKLILLFAIIIGYCNSFAQGWNTTFTPISEPTLEKMDLFTNINGNHLLIKRSNGNIVYYNFNSQGQVNTGKTVTLQASGDFPVITGSNDVVYAIYKTGNVIRIKHSTNGGSSWLTSITDRYITANLCNGIDAVYELGQGIHLVWATQDNYPNFETYYYQLDLSHTWTGYKNITDYSQYEVGGAPTVTYSQDRVHVSYNLKGGVQPYSIVKTRDKSDGHWDPPQFISTVDESMAERLEVRGSSLYIVYAKFFYNYPIVFFHLTYKSRALLGNWTTGEGTIIDYTILEDPTSFNLCKTFNDNLQVVYVDDTGDPFSFCHRRFDGSWSYPPFPVDGNQYFDFVSKGLSTSSNDVFVTWKRETDSYIRYRQWDDLPLAPQNLLLRKFPSGSNYVVKVTWSANTEVDISLYEIWRKVLGSSCLEHDWQVIGTSSTNSYIDYDYFYGGSCYLYYKVRAKDIGNHYSNFSTEISGRGGIAPKIGDEQNVNKSLNYFLSNNYPNPFNPTTTINYSIQTAGEVTLKVYDMLGIEVANLVSERQEAGNYSVAFNASDLPSGIYFYTLTSGNFNSTKKLILLK